VSLRDITTAAEVNVGAINYHFGSKDRLVMEVFARRLAPVNRERIAQLDALERAAGERAPELSEIVEAIVRPSVESEPGGEAIMRLISRSFVEPSPGLKRFVEEQFAEVARRFDSAILRALPGLSQGELFWRMNFLIGALHHAQEVWVRFDQVRRPGENLVAARLDREGFIQRVVAFMTAGMCAEVPRVGKVSTRSSK
jgi:AcrR family transcriptional regulator